MAGLNINGGNFDKSYTEINLKASFISSIPLTEYVSGISYKETQNIEYLYEMSDTPTHLGYGPKRSSGNIVISDAGLNKLNDTAKNFGVNSIVDFGKLLDLSLIIEYFDFNNEITTDILYGVRFKNYTRGINTRSNINNRRLNFIIGKIYKDTAIPT